MVLVSALRIGLWDPFQMGFLLLINGGYPITTYKSWDDPPSGNMNTHTIHVWNIYLHLPKFIVPVKSLGIQSLSENGNGS